MAADPGPALRPIHSTAAPEPVGPYNQAVVAGGLLFCSGQIALDPQTGVLMGAGCVEAVLAAAGCGPERVVRTTVFLTDLGDFAAVNAIYAETFGAGVSPARACVQVAALPKGARVEIDAIALLS
jgi:reactive intermediate/imine deaminase